MPLTAVPPCPVAPGDRVSTPHDTEGTVTYVRWVPPGPDRLVPSRDRPGHWLAGVWEDVGVEQPARCRSPSRTSAARG